MLYIIYYIIYLEESDLNMTLSKCQDSWLRDLNIIGKRAASYNLWVGLHSSERVRTATEYETLDTMYSFDTQLKSIFHDIIVAIHDDQWKSSSGVLALSIVGRSYQVLIEGRVFIWVSTTVKHSTDFQVLPWDIQMQI